MKFAVMMIGLGLLAAGCVESHRAQPEVYYVPSPAIAPTSNGTQTRVYSTLPSTPPLNVSSKDVALAQSISDLLKGDPHMATASQAVRVTVRDRIVTLDGTVPSEPDRDEIVERVSQLAGVGAVRNHLAVER